MRVRGPNNIGRAVQLDPTLLRHASANTEQKKCWTVVGSKLQPVSNFAQKLSITRNNMQQGVQTDTTCNIQHRWELLADNVASVCAGLKRA